MCESRERVVFILNHDSAEQLRRAKIQIDAACECPYSPEFRPRLELVRKLQPSVMDVSEPSPTALTYSDLPDLKLLSRGKVRDNYETSSPDHLLFVASDRIAAYDVILQNVSRLTPLRLVLL